MDRQTRTRACAPFLSILACALAALTSACDAQQQATAASGTSAAAGRGTSRCSFAEPVRGADGTARLALLVGVGAYAHGSIADLHGPAADVRNMHALLTGPGGYGFPESNVCTLVDTEATGARFREAFQQAIVRRATKRNDVVVIFFAGHGTQLADNNRDESDGSDEVLMFVDSRTPTANDLRDDEFARLLQPLRTATGNVVVIVDSCNSGSATRAANASLTPRYQRPRPEDLAAIESAAQVAGDGASTYFIDSAPGLITISAAVDGTVAMEKGGTGVFTEAFVAALSQVEQQPLTYRQLQRRVPALVAAKSSQTARFEGDLDLVVFGATKRARPLALDVVSVGSTIKLGGTVMPGLGRNSELRVYDSSLSGTDFNDPKKSKAMLLVESASGLNAEAKVLSTPSNAKAIKPGDLAVLVRPSDETIAMRVRVRPANEPLGVPRAGFEELRKQLGEHSEAKLLVSLTDQLSDFEVTKDASGKYNILGPEGRIRNVMQAEASVVENLWLHARQRAFRNLRTEGGAEFVDDSSLIVSIEPAQGPQPVCAQGTSLSRDAKGTYIVPLCYRWNLRVKLAPGVQSRLRLGGLVLSTDGSVFGFPRRGSIATIEPGGPDVVFSQTFHGLPPLGIEDHLIVFGTKEGNPVDWERLSATAATRSAQPPPATGPLYRALDRYLRGPGSRGVGADDTAFEDSAWTRTTVALRTEANAAFEPDGQAVNPGSREYTIKSFDIRPYLPDDTNTPLHKVLQVAHALTKENRPYKQHPWDKGSDSANLAAGIDCSRSIWFAFTRAGQPYNNGDRYLTTAQMVAPTSAMSERFESCPLGSDLETGDLLVYRDDQQGDGHVVMVIDGPKRIAWGSHGWDGNAKQFGTPPETGVEYQLIKFKKDWERWDRSNMKLRACWRYKPFTEARSRGTGLPGYAAITDKPCEGPVCKPRPPL